MRRADGTGTRLHAELGPKWVLLAHPDADVHPALDLARTHLGDDRVVVLRLLDSYQDERYPVGRWCCG
jgi:hypothetical protein